jgi:NAD(P)-dependent dehydrogenase (short-subunit alcohol dehydrogenase family)
MVHGERCGRRILSKSLAVSGAGLLYSMEALIAAVAAFLASPDSSFMTASEVAVDGCLAQL